MLLGTRGGSFQPQILLQLIDHMLGSGLDPAEAMRRPRWVVDDEEPERSVVHVESRMGPEIVAGLETRGHVVRTAGPWEAGWGPVAVISVDAGVRAEIWVMDVPSLIRCVAAPHQARGVKQSDP